MEQSKPTITYTPHLDYTTPNSQGFHKPVPPRSINIGVPLQPLRPVHDPSMRQERWAPYNLPSRPQNAPEIMTEKSPFLTVPGAQPLHLRTSLQCRDDMCKSHFSPYVRQGQNGFFSDLRSLFTMYFVEWWMLEILSWTFSALCMASILGVLSFYDGKELPQWFLGITLNGFISVFSGLAKASLLLPTAEALGQLKWNWFTKDTRNLLDFEVFDAASRGPWGSILLMGRMKGISLSCIGAVIILAAVPLDLFFQQIVQYPAVWIPTTTDATVPRVFSYLPPNQISFINGNEVSARDQYLTTVLSSSFFSNGSLPELDLYCPTKNCTWPAFETLAVCGACSESVAQQLTFGCYEGPADWLSTSKPVNSSTWANITSCGYWLNATSDDRILMTGYEVDQTTNKPGEALGMRILPLVSAFDRTPSYQTGSLLFKDIKNPLVDFFVGGTETLADVYQNSTPVAHECVLHWCVQQLEMSHSWGVLSQNVTATWSNSQDPINATFPWFISHFDDGSVDFYYPGDNITITVPQNDEATSDLGKAAGDQVFSLSNTTMIQTSFLMDDFAPTWITMTSASSRPIMKYESVEAKGLRSMPLVDNPWLSPSNLTGHVELMAKIMTTAMRTKVANGGDMDLVKGTAWDTRVHVHIRWPYMTLPLILLCLTLVFLVATVVKSTREESQVRIYKTSSLATLVNGVGDEVQSSFGPNCRMGKARARARELSVKLVPE